MRPRLNYANVISTIALFVALGGGAYAAVTLQKGDVTSKHVADNTLKSKDLKDGKAVTGQDVKDDSLRGADILESNLDLKVLDGRPAREYTTRDDLVPFNVKLDFGRTARFVKVGPISLIAECREDVSGSNDQIRIYADTTEDGAFVDGDSNKTGPGNGTGYLNTDTPRDASQVADALTSVPGEPGLEFDIDTAFVAGPDADEYIGLDETIALGLNVGGADCLAMGYATVLSS